MKRFFLCSALPVLTIFLAVPWVGSAFTSNESSTVSSATRDLKIAVHSKSITPQELQQAHGIAIIPFYWKAALVGDRRHGVGVLMVKTTNHRWSNPTFISASGGSLGAHVGFVAGDMIMLFKNEQDVDKILNGRFRLGVSATAAAGHGAKSQTNASPSNVSTYVDTPGGFIGVSARGVEISAEQNSNTIFYGNEDATAKTIAKGQVMAPQPAKDLRTTADNLTTAG
ncbi:MAG: lipid-binding SYLF domain-containing protein [Syntrophobacteraceae bacterium]|nr:lipid-binding SYLF domain-containing protein [Syntrophobacteraceae bacterium]